MRANDVTHNVENKLGLSSMFSRTGIGTSENKTDSLSYDATSSESIPFPSTALFFASPTTSSKSLTDDRFQYYIIGVYAFFVTLFVLGIFIAIATKLYRACSIVSDDEYDSVSQGLNVSDSPVSEHHVNVDSTDVIRTQQEYDSDYDYYSDVSNGDKDDSKGTPPEYEEPPSYSAVSPPPSTNV